MATQFDNHLVGKLNHIAGDQNQDGQHRQLGQVGHKLDSP